MKVVDNRSGAVSAEGKVLLVEPKGDGALLLTVDTGYRVLLSKEDLEKIFAHKVMERMTKQA